MSDTRTDEERRRDEQLGQRTPEEEAAWGRGVARENAEQADRADAERMARAAPEQQPAEPLPDMRGGQVVLDPDGDASRAARGTLYATPEENQAAYQTEQERLEAEQKVADAKLKLETAQAELEAAETARAERGKAHPTPARV